MRSYSSSGLSSRHNQGNPEGPASNFSAGIILARLKNRLDIENRNFTDYHEVKIIDGTTYEKKQNMASD